MNNTDAVVIGYGTIGKATAKALGIEKYYSRSKSNVTLKQASECKFVFICLPTNVNKEGKYDTKAIEEIADQVATDDNIIIIRSTVYPGFCRSLSKRLGINVVFNPEFLSEDTAVEDAMSPDLIILGSDNIRSAQAVRDFYDAHLIDLKDDPIITNFETAEFIKIGLNGFFTTKVVFANEMYDYAHDVGADYELFRDVLENHKWGTSNHLEIFHKQGRGAGGKCLKKDMEALAYYSKRSFFSITKQINNMFLEVTNKK